jgi:hypothetical protein
VLLSTLFALGCGGGQISTGDGTFSETGEEADTGDAEQADTGDSEEGGGVTDEPLPICINELMSDNASVYEHPDGRFPDWIELHNPTAEAVDLGGWTLSDKRDDDGPPAIADGTVLPAGGFAVFDAVGELASEPDDLPFALAAEGGEVALFAPDGRGAIVTYGPSTGDFSLARTTDCCTGQGCLGWTYRGTPGDSNVAPTLSWTEVLSLGSTWTYKDDGAEVGGWMATAYDDSGWSSGPAPLGYGDEGMSTTVSYGDDAANKHLTTWFRTHVTVSDAPTVRAVRLDLRRDDGAIVYVNGAEAVRSNMPEGAVDGSTLAPTSTSGPSETAIWQLDLEPELFVEGDNVLAVEVHQHSVDSSDLVLDAALSIARNAQ